MIIVKSFGEGDEKRNVLGGFAAFIETLSIHLVIEKTKKALARVEARAKAA